MREQERIAERVFSKYGLEFKDAARAGGWANGRVLSLMDFEHSIIEPSEILF